MIGLPTRVALYRWPAWFHEDAGAWVAWCPAVDVMTQARTKKVALERLQGAVELWVESCVERGVLKEALAEVGIEVTDAQ